MDHTLVSIMFELTNTLSKIDARNRNEQLAYNKGVQFAEKFFHLGSLIIDSQVDDLTKQRDDDDDQNEIPTTMRGIE